MNTSYLPFALCLISAFLILSIVRTWVDMVICTCAIVATYIGGVIVGKSRRSNK